MNVPSDPRLNSGMPELASKAAPKDASKAGSTTSTDALIIDIKAIQRAARMLEAGELVAFPSETVYGLGADAENPAAVANIYAAKGRPSNHPVIVHIAPEADLGFWAQAIPPQAYQLITAFWPGPLTLILQRADHVSSALSGGQTSIGIRCPSHPVAQALLREFKAGKGGIAGPSANKFGHVSPTTAQHVRDEFGDGVNSPIAYVLDGGQSEVGIESTIIDLSRIATHGPVLLRPGDISTAEIAAVLGAPVHAADSGAPRASGTLESHYAPLTPVLQIAPVDLLAALSQMHQDGQRLALISYSAGAEKTVPLVAHYPMPEAPHGYAHNLYAALRELDQAGADMIVVEAPPQDNAWQGINDRLRRAAYALTDKFSQYKHL
ncbi:L-threonylcarbamoyladenylate synthase [Glaciimonas sp. Gout2]|uniref:L-threonylcarbamoyladenylate synthase n=1 Tax=unclassified Glaciimonas TaxID=2644401 RepID=UPI002B2227A6|nr:MULTISPECIES: L-threonylcarbamoyladenylate synthase [unclassified Glaciimonas]MEB0011803.1 L-threonylcarbamoyladenylate synthase [Glaciimonas sp. Cout2]MEB0080641.1 L-threonylcarbamoyladenylate synthase [Glaciimonas sp. Gout2]